MNSTTRGVTVAQRSRRPSYSRPGPGIYFVTEDQRIKGKWFIHHDGTLEVAFLPY
jgi:hypothetical protein